MSQAHEGLRRTTIFTGVRIPGKIAAGEELRLEQLVAPDGTRLMVDHIAVCVVQRNGFKIETARVVSRAHLAVRIDGVTVLAGPADLFWASSGFSSGFGPAAPENRLPESLLVVGGNVIEASLRWGFAWSDDTPPDAIARLLICGTPLLK